VAGLGGPALYLAGVAAFKRATGATNLPFSHELGLGALAALAFVAPWTQPWQLAIGIASVMIGVAVWETLSLGARHRAAEDMAKRETRH
jgi:low temperature requirement protein LtrA